MIATEHPSMIPDIEPSESCTIFTLPITLYVIQIHRNFFLVLASYYFDDNIEIGRIKDKEHDTRSLSDVG